MANIALGREIGAVTDVCMECQQEPTDNAVTMRMDRTGATQILSEQGDPWLAGFCASCEERVTRRHAVRRAEWELEQATADFVRVSKQLVQAEAELAELTSN